MNVIFILMVLCAFCFSGWQQIFSAPVQGAPSPMAALSAAMIKSAGGSVELAIGLVGVMALFLGLMKVAEAGGMLTILARLIRPLMVRLFPDVPADHPAMGAMILNLSANMLGLGNAATPFGIRAMQELDKLIALRAAAGSSDPAAILPTTLFATIGSTIVAVIAAKTYQRIVPLKTVAGGTVSKTPLENEEDIPLKEAADGYPIWVSLLALAFLVALIPVAVVYGRLVSPWILPALMVGFLGFGLVRRVRVYEVFVEGAKDGFKVAVRIIPYLVAILVAVDMLRASGAMTAVSGMLGGVTGRFGLPAEALPMALMRPFSGSGAYGILASIINDPSIGPDSYTGYLVSTLQGSTETTFYVMAVYFGAVQVRRIRHSLAAGLTADVAAVIFAVLACSFFLR
jgi:spore maturation protein SpmB/spore maturation protein SpmA